MTASFVVHSACNEIAGKLFVCLSYGDREKLGAYFRLIREKMKRYIEANDV